MIKKLITFLMAIIISLSLYGCQSKTNDSDVGELLEFSYNFGSYHDGYWEFSIYREQEKDTQAEKIYFKAEGYNGVDLDVLCEVDQSVLDDIFKIIEENNIFAWDGFDQRDDDVLDGYSFSLSATFQNGFIKSSGYMKEPDGYEKGHTALFAYLDALAAKK